MDRSTIRTEVRDIVGELSADFWTDAELNRYINEAARRFAGENRWHWLITEGTAQLTSGSPELLLVEAVDHYRHLAILLTRDGSSAPYLAKMVSPARAFALKQQFYTSSAYPEFYYIASAEDTTGTGGYTTTVKFLPSPSVDIDVAYQYYRTPAELDGDSDVPDIPQRYHKALVHHAAGTAWLKELNAGQKAGEQFQMYDAIVVEAKMEEEGAPDHQPLIVGGDAAPGAPLYARDYALRRIPDRLGP